MISIPARQSHPYALKPREQDHFMCKCFSQSILSFYYEYLPLQFLYPLKTPTHLWKYSLNNTSWTILPFRKSSSFYPMSNHTHFLEQWVSLLLWFLRASQLKIPSAHHCAWNTICCMNLFECMTYFLDSSMRSSQVLLVIQVEQQTQYSSKLIIMV